MFINMQEMRGSVGKDCIFVELTLVAMLSAGQYGFTSQSPATRVWRVLFVRGPRPRLRVAAFGAYALTLQMRQRGISLARLRQRLLKEGRLPTHRRRRFLGVFGFAGDFRLIV